MIRRSNRPPTESEIKQMLIAAFCMGMIITSAYFTLFILK